ncbi:hypothetical protein H1C71_042218 [Ictidomys tridecemlineatus]|nr:hypothetical protein H1C71_042218 [Ictidomys tridecemlineatus]
MWLASFAGFLCSLLCVCPSAACEGRATKSQRPRCHRWRGGDEGLSSALVLCVLKRWRTSDLSQRTGRLAAQRSQESPSGKDRGVGSLRPRDGKREALGHTAT